MSEKITMEEIDAHIEQERKKDKEAAWLWYQNKIAENDQYCPYELDMNNRRVKCNCSKWERAQCAQEV